MTAKNIMTFPSGDRDSIVEFEVYCQQTNFGSPGVDPFEFCCGQYTWYYNKAIFPPGGVIPTGPGNSFSLRDSDLPTSLVPPSTQIDTARGYLQTSANLPSSFINYHISSIFPGTMMGRFRIRTTAQAFNPVPLNLQFKLGAAPNTFIAYFLPYPDSVDTETFPPPQQFAVALRDTITNVYSVVDGEFALPVELASFVSGVNKNVVTLNWTTSSETNNQGFDIERKAAGTEDWSKVGYLNGIGTTTEQRSYSFNDRADVGSYNYRLKQIDFNGSYNYHALTSEVVVGIPTVYAISQNYPNPFNPTTKIDFELPYDGKVSIILYDISGREVAKLVNEVMTAGFHNTQFNGSNLASGMYFYRISAQGGNQNFVNTKKMMLIK
jgi:hypothetical protein